jgi:hypothetical protein
MASHIPLPLLRLSPLPIPLTLLGRLCLLIYSSPGFGSLSADQSSVPYTTTSSPDPGLRA